MTQAKRIIILDGIRIQLAKPDLDGDGEVGGVETIKQDDGIREIVQPTELGDTLKELNQAGIDPGTKMSAIDLRSRLGRWEVPPLMAVDALVAFRVVSQRCLMLTMQKKRLNVSIEGEGRKEIVDIVGGKREHDEKKGQGGIMAGIKGMMTPTGK